MEEKITIAELKKKLIRILDSDKTVKDKLNELAKLRDIYLYFVDWEHPYQIVGIGLDELDPDSSDAALILGSTDINATGWTSIGYTDFLCVDKNEYKKFTYVTRNNMEFLSLIRVETLREFVKIRNSMNHELHKFATLLIEMTEMMMTIAPVNSVTVCELEMINNIKFKLDKLLSMWEKNTEELGKYHQNYK